ncbi:MAG: hypothetical protein AB7S26_22620 [Sandaracinaceae bacterium]
MRGVGRASILLWSALSLACGAGRPPPTPPPALDDDDGGSERVRIAGIRLPRLPVDVSPDDELLANGWAQTEVALRMPTPSPPEGEAWEVEAWASEELPRWMQRRAEAITTAQHALQTARDGDPRYSVVASTLLGIAYSRFAMEVRSIPVPGAFAGDEERQRELHDALEHAAYPIWLHAMDAFGSCSRVAADAPAHSLARWREACDREIHEIEALIPDDPRPDEDEDEDEDGHEDNEEQ